MAITVNIYYTGTNGSARRFAKEMTEGGTVAAIRAEEGDHDKKRVFTRAQGADLGGGGGCAA